MTEDDIKKLLKTIGVMANNLPEKSYTKHEVKQLLLQVVKEIENEHNR